MPKPSGPKKQSLKDVLGDEIVELKSIAGGMVYIVAESVMPFGFAQLLDERAELSQTITELELAKEQLSMEIAKALVARGYMGSDGDHGKVRILTSERSKLDATKLINHGVSTTTIDACTETNTSYALRVDKA